MLLLYPSLTCQTWNFSSWCHQSFPIRSREERYVFKFCTHLWERRPWKPFEALHLQGSLIFRMVLVKLLLPTFGYFKQIDCMESIWRSEIRFLLGAQNFLFVPCLWQDKKRLSQYIPCCHVSVQSWIRVDFKMWKEQWSGRQGVAKFVADVVTTFWCLSFGMFIYLSLLGKIYLFLTMFQHVFVFW